MKLQGVYTALVTPFDENQKVDFEALEENIKFQIESKVSGIVVLGTTGETPTLERSEQNEIIKRAVNLAKGKIQIIIGAGSNSTSSTIESVKIASDMGADAVLVVTPYYNKPTQEGIYLHFEKIANETNIPVIVYNIKGRTGVNIETETLLRLSKLPNIIGVKEASGDINQMGDVILKIANDDFQVLCGDDALTIPSMALGATGVVSVASNLIPKELVSMTNFALQNDFESARKIHFKFLTLFKTLFIETNPIPIKEAMNLCGMNAGGFRLPLCNLKNDNKEKLKNILKELNLF